MQKPQKLNVKLTKIDNGLMAQCMDNPAIIVSGKNKTQIKSKFKEIIDGYIQAFPETKTDFFTKNNKMFEVVFTEN